MPSSTGIIFYGPPASGKDTITRLLEELRREYIIFPKLKVGRGKTDSYRMTTHRQVQALIGRGETLYVNRRYGNTYVIDRSLLNSLIQGRQKPIVHVGQCESVLAVSRYPIRWVRILLWCGREVTERRARARGDVDVQARLDAWDETFYDLINNRAMEFDIAIRTDSTAPPLAASIVDRTVQNASTERVGVSDLIAAWGGAMAVYSSGSAENYAISDRTAPQ